MYLYLILVFFGWNSQWNITGVLPQLKLKNILASYILHESSFDLYGMSKVRQRLHILLQCQVLTLVERSLHPSYSSDCA